ncbi:transcription termination factor NusB [Bradyrhizobium sp. LM3.4]
MPSQRFAPPSEVPGLAARRIAADIVDGVLQKHRTLDEQLDGSGAHPGLKTLPDRDRALMRRLVATVLRRLGTLGHVMSRLLDKGIPSDAPRAQSALLIGAAQILWMDVPDHAAVDLSVRLVQSDRRAARYAGLVNTPCCAVAPARARRWWKRLPRSRWICRLGCSRAGARITARRSQGTWRSRSATTLRWI